MGLSDRHVNDCEQGTGGHAASNLRRLTGRIGFQPTLDDDLTQLRALLSVGHAINASLFSSSYALSAHNQLELLEAVIGHRIGEDMEASFDFVVVGSGAAGLVGAIAAHRAGLRPLIIEKSAKWGGTTALSGGVLWIPQNDAMVAEGSTDTPELSRTYVHNLLGSVPSAREIAKADAYLAAAPEMARMLSGEGVSWVRNREHPDYYPEVEGSACGRTLEALPIDGRRLGADLATLNNAELDIPAMDSSVFGTVVRAKTAVQPFLKAAEIVTRHKLRKLAGQKPLGMGRGLAANLMVIIRSLKIPVHLETKLVSLVEERGYVVGVVVEREGRRERLDAPAGVLLSAGGFAQNPALRSELQGFDKTWSNASPNDQGDAFLAARAIGSETELLEDCWWMPSIEIGPGKFGLALGHRALPGSIVVDARGKRYMNEARSYMETGKVMREHGAAQERHWLIMDDRFLHRYIFADLSQAAVRESMLAFGTLKRSDSVEGLAAQCGLDPRSLAATISRFNGFARAGKDEDFQRGETSYDRYWADPNNKPNASLAEIKKPPYWAAVIRPGDLGTNGGVRTDEYGRVLGSQDKPIEGLYAAGNGSGSPFGHAYPGAGATIGAAASFGYIAARHAAARRVNAPPAFAGA